jgi:hypothetical protein
MVFVKLLLQDAVDGEDISWNLIPTVQGYRTHHGKSVRSCDLLIRPRAWTGSAFSNGKQAAHIRHSLGPPEEQAS